jgi:hypothetical protein
MSVEGSRQLSRSLDVEDVVGLETMVKNVTDPKMNLFQRSWVSLCQKVIVRLYIVTTIVYIFDRCDENYAHEYFAVPPMDSVPCKVIPTPMI